MGQALLLINHFSLFLSNTAITNNSKGGILFTDCVPNWPSVTNPYIQNTTISNNSENGFSIISCEYSSKLDQFTIKNSNIVGNKFGLTNFEGITSKSTNNYWGDSSGPYHPSQNTAGKGDSVSASANIDPCQLSLTQMPHPFPRKI